MPGGGEIDGGSAVLNFVVVDKQGNVINEWYAKDPHVKLKRDVIKIELLGRFTANRSGTTITVPLQKGPTIRIQWGDVPSRIKRRKRR